MSLSSGSLEDVVDGAFGDGVSTTIHLASTKSGGTDMFIEGDDDSDQELERTVSGHFISKRRAFSERRHSLSLSSPHLRDVSKEKEDDLRTVEELCQRIEEYRGIITQLQSERDGVLDRFEAESERLLLRQKSKLTHESEVVKFALPVDIKALRVYTDSGGLHSNRFSAQFVHGDDVWHEYDDVVVECKRDGDATDPEFNFDLDEPEPVDYFAGVIERVHKGVTADSLLDVEAEDDSCVKLEETPTMRDAVLFLQDLEKKQSAEEKKEESSSTVSKRGIRHAAGESMIFNSWAGDAAIFTRGKTIHVLRGIRTEHSLRAADFYMSLRERWRHKRPIRILTLDGGGLRGTLQCQLLKEIEKGAGGVSIGKCFDLIVGSSAGGIFAIEMGKLGWNCQMADEMVHNLGHLHFAKKKGALGKLRKIVYDAEVYDTEKFRADIKHMWFGDGEDIPFKGRGVDTGAHVAVTAVRCDYLPWQPFVFRTYDFEQTISCFAGTCKTTAMQACGATTAAPILMKPMKIPKAKVHRQKSQFLGKVVRHDEMADFWDGGVYQNNPSLTAYFEAKQLFGYSKDIVMVSVGTGHLPKQYNAHASTGSGWMKLGGELTKGLFQAKEVQNRQLLRQLLQEDVDFFRFDMTVERDENDRVSLMPYFVKRAKAWLRKHDAATAQLQALGRFFAGFADDPLPEDISQD